MMTRTRPSAPLPATEPIPISLIGGRYLVFDINAITHLRAQHNICGVLTGSIPHLPQQNVFLGVPLELMPEEARLLAEENVGFVVDDVVWHRDGLDWLGGDEKQAFVQTLHDRGLDVAKAAAERAEERTEKALAKRKAKLAVVNPTSGRTPLNEADNAETDGSNNNESIPTSTTPSPPPKSVSRASTARSEPHIITPTTSYPPLHRPPRAQTLPQVPTSYHLFAHLHAQKYFLSPGLRFGCQYLVYPGDPLRFHSHFLAVSFEWDEELNLMDLVAGGRLGTGVKKGFLIGGVEKKGDVAEECYNSEAGAARTFCIEWGGM